MTEEQIIKGQLIKELEKNKQNLIIYEYTK